MLPFRRPNPLTLGQERSFVLLLVGFALAAQAGCGDENVPVGSMGRSVTAGRGGSEPGEGGAPASGGARSDTAGAANFGAIDGGSGEGSGAGGSSGSGIGGNAGTVTPTGGTGPATAGAGGSTAGLGGSASGAGGTAACDPLATPGCRGLHLYAGEAHNCLLHENGQVTCWGVDAVRIDDQWIEGLSSPAPGPFTRLSIGTASCGFNAANVATCWSLPPADVAVTGEALLEVSSQAERACVLRMNGELHCWGGYGDASADNEAALAPFGPFASVTVGAGYICALTADGSAHCAGENYMGQAIVAPPSRFKNVQAGRYHACGLRLDDTIECWGDNTFGETDAPAGTFRQVSTAGVASCALRADGTIDCWGSIDTVPSGSFVEVSVGSHVDPTIVVRDHACALDAGGRVTCWYNPSLAPIDPIRLHPPPDLAAEPWTLTELSVAGVVKNEGFSGRHEGSSSVGCGVLGDGSAECWDGSPALEGGPFEQISAWPGYVCALGTDRRLSCLDDGPVPTAAEFTSISVGAHRGCGVLVGGELSCWEWWNVNAPAAPGGTFSQVSLSPADQNDSTPRACGLLTDGDVLCWGGALGERVIAGPFVQVSSGFAWDFALRDDGSIVRLDPTNGEDAPLVPGPFVRIAAGEGVVHSLAADGTAHSISAADGAELGGAPDEAFVAIAAGGDFACGLRADGDFRCWGNVVR